MKVLIEQISYLGWSVCCTQAPGHYRRQFRFTRAGANIPKNTRVLLGEKVMNHLSFKVNTSITNAKLKQALRRCKTVQDERGGLMSVAFPKGVNLVKLVTNARGKPARKASRLDLDQRGEQRDGGEENTLKKISSKLNVSG